MQLTLEETIVLSDSIQAQDKGILAEFACNKLKTPRFDQRVAMTVIDNLVATKLLSRSSNGKYTITEDGREAMKAAHDELQLIMMHLRTQITS